MRTWPSTCSGCRAPSEGTVMRPLEGITVVTLEHAIAAPFCTRQLADLGARVIKVERPGSGDFARAYDERVKGMGSHFVRRPRGCSRTCSKARPAWCRAWPRAPRRDWACRSRHCMRNPLD